MVSGTVSPPCPGYFSPFPHGTGSLSVSQEYLALPDGAGGFGRGFTCPDLLRIPLGVLSASRTGPSPSTARCPNLFRSLQYCHSVVLQPRSGLDRLGLGCSRFARHYFGNHSCFLFLRVLRCFSSPRWPPCGCHVFNMTGCPIRRPPGQSVLAGNRGLSQLIASFFASESLGILHAPLYTFSH